MTNLSDPFVQAVVDTERHVARFGWDQPLRLFAVVSTADLLQREPQLAEQLQASDPTAATAQFTSLEQEELPTQDVESLLAQLAWPESVDGVVLAVERIVVPPEVGDTLPEDEDAAMDVLENHPERHDVRIVVGVHRAGARVCLLRQRDNDADDQVAVGEEIAPALLDALAATLED